MTNIQIHKSPTGGARPKVSIILLDWGCRERFHALDWLARQDVPRSDYELIWVELYDRVVPEVLEKTDTLITCGQQGMYHKHGGYNVGLLHSRGQIVTVCDSDAVFPPDFISSILKAFDFLQSDRPVSKVLMHYEPRSRSLYPDGMTDLAELKKHEWETWPNVGACMSVTRADAIRFGGFDEHESYLGYVCGPYDLGWRLVNAGIPEQWVNDAFIFHFAHPQSNASANTGDWKEITYPHIDYHARMAVEAFSTGRLLPLLENLEVHQLRMEARTIGSPFEEKYAKMPEQFVQNEASQLQVKTQEQIKTDVWYESEHAHKAPLITAIVSSYNAERFMRGLLEDLESQTIADRLEIVVIDSNSPQNEAAIVREFQQRYNNIRFMRTSVREQSHITLNRCIRAARGKYITLACTDDRHRADAYEKMAAVLDNDLNVSLVYGDVAITEKENQTLESADIIGYYQWPEFSRDSLFQVCYMGHQPMWRKSLHDKYGYFDESFISAGDYELWLRFASKGENFKHIAEALGLYLLSSSGNEHSNRDLSARESLQAIQRYWNQDWGQCPSFGGTYFVEANNDKPQGRAGLHPLGGAPLVSVIIPTHNRPVLLQDTLKSLIAQTYPHWEAIVINDGGNSVEKLVSGMDSQNRIRYLEHATNYGQVSAKNTGLRAAHGQIICYLDDDDVFRPDHLATVVNDMARTNIPFVYTDAEYILEELKDGKRHELGRARPFENIEHTKERLLVQNYIPINAWAHRRECLKTVGLFDESLPSLEDWELLLRFARDFDLTHIPKITVDVRQRNQVADNVTRKQMHTYLEVYKNIYSRHEWGSTEDIMSQRETMLKKIEEGKGQVIQSQPQGGPSPQSDYETWIYKHSLQEIDGQIMAERMVLKWKTKPIIHLVMMLNEGELPMLADTIDSLGTQMYNNWRLTVVSPLASPDPLFEQSEVLNWYQMQAGEYYDGAINHVISALPGDWIAPVEPGIQFEPQSLFSFVDYINIRPNWALIYADEDKITKDGKRIDPLFKPDFNLDMIRSTPYFGALVMMSRKAVETVGGVGHMVGAERYDLSLKILDRYGEEAVGHISDVLSHVPAERQNTTAEEAHRDALKSHLERHGIQAEIANGMLPSSFRVNYKHVDQPLVSIIIPTRDKLEVLAPCLDSLLSKTTYPNFEIIVVDNQSTDPDLPEYLGKLEAEHAGKVRILHYPEAFNFSAICNLGAKEAKGEYLLLLNNDTHIVQAEWLDRMMSHAQRKEVGIVGARLVFPETNRIQHAGVILGLSEVADHPYLDNLRIDEIGYMGRTHMDQNFSAVSGACLLIRKSLYEEVEGMDELNLHYLYGDIDLCLKVSKRGYKTVWTPHATVVHHGSATRKSEARDPVLKGKIHEQNLKETGVMFDRWLPRLANDPAYSRHLSLLSRDYQLDSNVVIDWDTHFHDRQRILGIPLPGGSGEYRMIAPFRALGQAGHAKCNVIQMQKMKETRVLTIPELARADPDVLMLHAALSDPQLQAMGYYKQYSRAFRIFTLDDLVTNVPEQSPFFKHAFKDAKSRLRKALSLNNRAIVTTEPLADLCKTMIDDVRVVPNRLEKAKWENLVSLRRQGKKPRVGWAGAQQHHGDLALVEEVVKATANEVDWVFFGMCTDALRPYIKEFHDFVLSFEEYPKKLASLNLDIAIAPLELHPFNEAKSNLRLLEYGILGWNVICSDVYPYRNAPVKRVPNNPEAWIQAIRERASDLDAAGVEGDILRKWVREHYLLEDHLDEWVSAIFP